MVARFATVLVHRIRSNRRRLKPTFKRFWSYPEFPHVASTKLSHLRDPYAISLEKSTKPRRIMEECCKKPPANRPSFLQGLMLLLVGTYLFLTALGFSIAIQLFLGPFLMLYGLYLMLKKSWYQPSNPE